MVKWIKYMLHCVVDKNYAWNSRFVIEMYKLRICHSFFVPQDLIKVEACIEFL